MKNIRSLAPENGKGARFGRKQIIEILREYEGGTRVPQLSRKYGVSRSTLYKWRAKFLCPVSAEALPSERTAMLEDENHRLKKLLGDVVLENYGLKETLAKKEGD